MLTVAVSPSSDIAHSHSLTITVVNSELQSSRLESSCEDANRAARVAYRVGFWVDILSDKETNIECRQIRSSEQYRTPEEGVRLRMRRNQWPFILGCHQRDSSVQRRRRAERGQQDRSL